MTQPASSVDVVVLGAGPAGLAAAWYAARKGLCVAVLDRAPAVGGLAASTIVDDQSVDLGSHRLHPSIRPDLLADLRDSLGVDLQWRPRHGRIRLHGRWVAFPLRPVDLMRHSSLAFAGGVLRDAATARWRTSSPADAAPSFGSEVRRHLGPTICSSFYEPYARKLWATPADDLSAELFRRRVSVRSPNALIARALPRRHPAGFWYPTQGFGTISTSLARGVEVLGGQVITGAELGEITLDERGARVGLVGGSQMFARTIVSTVPSAALATSVGAPADVVSSAHHLHTRAAVLVYLTVPRPQYTPFDAHYFPDSSTMVSRLSEPKNYRSSASDPRDRTVLCAEIPATVGDRTWTADDDVLLQRTADELGQVGLPDPSAIGGVVDRRTHVYPVYRVGFERERDAVDAYLARLPNLAVLGRQALFAHDNTHHALLMGKTVVDAISTTGQLDRARWDVARRAFADHTVED